MGKKDGAPREPTGPIQRCPESQDESRDHLLKAPGERIVTKTWRFHSLKDLWRKAFG